MGYVRSLPAVYRTDKCLHSVLNYISRFTTPKQTIMYNAICGTFWGIGAMLGPVVGGAFSDNSASWRWAFHINLPLAAGKQSDLPNP
jgi:MFS family permease